MAQNDVLEQLLQIYEDYRVAQLNFNADRRAADKTISAVYERIRQEKAENDVGIRECQKILGDTTRSDGARTAAGVRLEVLLTKTFLITAEEKAEMSAAVGDVKEAYREIGEIRHKFDVAHTKARTALREMRDNVFGNNPGSENYGHTMQRLEERLIAALEYGKQ